MLKVLVVFLATLAFAGVAFSQPADTGMQKEIFWRVGEPGSITWDLTNETRLPHGDNIEISGQQVAAIISYEVNEDRDLTVTRDVIFPQLRVFIKSSEAWWRNYRAYLRDEYTDDVLPEIIVDERTYDFSPLDSVRIDGMLRFYHSERQGLKIVRTLLPSMTERLFVEVWEISNVSDSTRQLTIGPAKFHQEQMGVKGQYRRQVYTVADSEYVLQPSTTCKFAIYFAAYLNDEPEISTALEDVLAARQAFLDVMQTQLVLKTPDTILNTLFYFSKIRASESIFKTSMGLVNSPGGGRYYTGVWANDQAEYSGPFYPYLGYDVGNEAAMNAYLMFLKNLPDTGHFWSSFEMNGEIPCCGGDRGDAAMIAFGASQFALARGDRELGEQLWPLIDWSLEYCERQKNEAGVIASDTDEMEGRIPTGDANLSTSSLYYGALLQASYLAKALGKDKSSIGQYNQRATDLRETIDKHFGAELEGLKTYRYFDGHQRLRHWICLPLVMGIEDRKEGTLEALFSKLWTDNGVRVEFNPELEEPDLFWDRGTLYAFRGAFKSGAADAGLDRLQSYSKTRLLGFHVPYVVEAWPEGNMAHLSAESALYCRIFTEGLLGIVPTSFQGFTMRPHLPSEWDNLALSSVQAFGAALDIDISRQADGLRVSVTESGETVFDQTIQEGDEVNIVLAQ